MSNKMRPDPRGSAQRLLKKLSIHSLPVPVQKIAKSLGAEIRFSPLDEELSGMIYIMERVPIIGVNSLHHLNRQRFTIAHEIGHLELHREILLGQVHVDKGFSVLMRDSSSATGTQRIEIEANRFAAELLMPEYLLEHALDRAFDIDDDRPFAEVAKRFGVSKQALEYRIRNMA